MNVSKNNVIICPPTKRSIRKIAKVIGNDDYDWAYLGEDVTNALAVEEWVGARGKRIDISERLQETAKSLRQPYIDYIGKLSVQHNSILWWAGSLSETNTQRSKIFLRICYLKICVELSKSFNNIVFFIDDITVRHAVYENVSDSILIKNNSFVPIEFKLLGLSLIRKTFFILNTLYKSVLSKYFYTSTIPNHKVVILHTWVDERSFNDDEKYSDAYFGDLNKYLTKKGKRVAIMPHILPSASYQKMLSNITKCSENFIIPEYFLRLNDIFKSVFATIKIPKKRSHTQFLDLNIDEIIYIDQLEDWASAATSANILYFYIFKNCKRMGLEIESFIYGFENHSRQKILCSGLRQFIPTAKIIGYQHSTVSLMLLDHFISKFERDILPFPDKVITNGINSYNSLLKMGYDSTKMIIGGAIRYEKLLININHPFPIKKNTKNPTLFVALSYGKTETIELIVKLMKAFENKPEYNILLKLHPTMSFSQIENDVKRFGIFPKHFIISNKPVSKLLIESDLLIYASTTVCIEALAFGVPVLFVKSDYTLDHNPLESNCELFVSAKNPNEIVEMVDTIINMTDEELNIKRKQWKIAVSNFFGPVTPDTFSLFLLNDADS